METGEVAPPDVLAMQSKLVLDMQLPNEVDMRIAR